MTHMMKDSINEPNNSTGSQQVLVAGNAKKNGILGLVNYKTIQVADLFERSYLQPLEYLFFIFNKQLFPR